MTGHRLAPGCLLLWLVAGGCDAPHVTATKGGEPLRPPPSAAVEADTATWLAAAGAATSADLEHAVEVLRKRLHAADLAGKVELQGGKIKLDLPPSLSPEQRELVWSGRRLVLAELDSGDWLHEWQVVQHFGAKIGNMTRVYEGRELRYRGLLLDDVEDPKLQPLIPKHLELKPTQDVDGLKWVSLLRANTVKAECLRAEVWYEERWLVRCFLKEQDARIVHELTGARVGNYFAVGVEPGFVDVVIAATQLDGNQISLPAADELTAKLLAEAMQKKLPITLTERAR